MGVHIAYGGRYYAVVAMLIARLAGWELRVCVDVHICGWRADAWRHHKCDGITLIALPERRLLTRQSPRVSNSQ